MFKAVVMATMLLPVAANAAAAAFDEAAAIQKAKDTLAEQLTLTRKSAPMDMTVKSVEPETWNDSSLGCGKPGTMAAQVITDGYVVVLNAGGRDHIVHVAETHGVVCERPVLTRKPKEPMRVRGLDLMLQQAREDLAQRLNADPALIRVAGMKAQLWTDSGMECPRAGEEVQPGPIKGYRLSLQHQGRIYTYHTDMNDVRPCPAIETE
jgi:hypothetical protein